MHYISVHEQQSIETAGLQQGMRLVLEPGVAPLSSQITLTFTPGNPASDVPDLEVMVDRNITVQECLTCMITKAQLKGSQLSVLSSHV